MTEAYVEHINLTVREPVATANLLEELFNWKTRWQGEAIHGGLTVHVGGTSTYVALYRHSNLKDNATESYYRELGFNHLGVVVDDLDVTERKVIAAGFVTHSHADYEPGRRFYFEDNEGLEIEVISYAAA